MCSRTRTKKIVVGLALVVLPVASFACAFAYEDQLNGHDITHVIHNVLYFAFYCVVPVTVLIINVLLVRVKYVEHLSTPPQIWDFITSQPRPTPPCPPSW